MHTNSYTGPRLLAGELINERTTLYKAIQHYTMLYKTIQHYIRLYETIYDTIQRYTRLYDTIHSPRNFDKSSAAKNCRRYFEVRRQFGGNFFVTIN